jgi:DNA-binding transcriptional LysR family regulator
VRDAGVRYDERIERDMIIVPNGPLIASVVDLEVSAAVAGLGLIYSFEEFLHAALESGAMVPVLSDWWQSFPGPFLYYPSRAHMPGPLRALVDFLKTARV